MPVAGCAQIFEEFAKRPQADVQSSPHSMASKFHAPLPVVDPTADRFRGDAVLETLGPKDPADFGKRTGALVKIGI